jgi:hypothetical protein
MRKAGIILFLLALGNSAMAQRLNVGVTFQYLVLKQVNVQTDHIIPAGSFNYYKVDDNRWKFFGAGQSIVIGAIAQLDYKRFYVAIEPSYELNTYNYSVKCAVSPTVDETVTFKTLFFQVQAPIYVGYQFASANVMRYSIFAGAEPVFPYHVETRFVGEDQDPDISNRYGAYDMNNILYSNKPYMNSIVGIGFHFASLVRVDVRYKHRLDYPGDVYKASFNTVGFGLTYFLPLNLLKKKIYYEE